MPAIHTREPALVLRAGAQAREHLLEQGLRPEHISVVPGAAGGPKALGISGLDQAIFGRFLPRAPRPRTLIGASIGSWRFAAVAGAMAAAGAGIVAGRCRVVQRGGRGCRMRRFLALDR